MRLVDHFPPTQPPEDDENAGQQPKGTFEPGKRDVLAPPPGYTPPAPPEPAPQPPPSEPAPPQAPQPPGPPGPAVQLQPPAPGGAQQAVTAAYPGIVLVGGTWYVPAGLWPRVGAFLIDMIILLLLRSIILWIANVPEPNIDEMLGVMEKVVSAWMAGSMPSASLVSQLQELERPLRFAGWLNVAMCGMYFTLMHGLAATTLGKVCFGLNVMRRDGSPLGVWLALWRYVLYLVCAKLIYTAWLVPLNREKRTLYDMLATTNVFRPVRQRS